MAATLSLSESVHCSYPPQLSSASLCIAATLRACYHARIQDITVLYMADHTDPAFHRQRVPEHYSYTACALCVGSVCLDMSLERLVHCALN